MTGSGMQQARDLRAEETVEVVRNHEDGTRFEHGSSDPKPGGNVGWEWTRTDHVDGGGEQETHRASGRRDESHERKTGESRSARTRSSEGEPKARGTTTG
jgi:hypothetical protein